MKVTIFTPAYNRANTLPRLYESLKLQTIKDFEWVVVDDGSIDNTKELIENWQKENIINIRYKYQKNSGKMRAINSGVEISKGEFFFIVDSDDYITKDAVETIILEGETLPENMGGMIFRKINIVTGEITGKAYPKYKIDSTPIEIVYKFGIDGDKAEVFRTRYLRETPFRVYDGEKFVPEATVWIKIGVKYKMRYIDKGIYYFEYLEDGYTNNFLKLIKNNPRGFESYYSEMLKYNIPLKNKIKFFIRLLQSKYFKLVVGKR